MDNELKLYECSDKVREQLLDIDAKITKLIKYGYQLPNIVFHDVNKETAKELSIGLMKLFKYRGVYSHFCSGKTSVDFDLNNKYRVLIINDKSIDELDDRTWDKYMKYLDTNHTSCVLILDGNLCSCFPNRGIEMDGLFRGSYILKYNYDKPSIEDIFNEFVKELTNRNIEIRISKEGIKKVISGFLDDFALSACTLAQLMIDEATSACILVGQDTFTPTLAQSLGWPYFSEHYESSQPKEEVPAQPLKEKTKMKLIGLTNIKKEISSLKNYLSFLKKCDNKDKKIYLNMFFMGNPGTGKTTVARMYKDILLKLGFIKEDKLIEITPNDLTGNHVGDTRLETQKILNRAKDGLLFIDEAYLLYQNSYKEGKNPFMEEAVVELIKYLDDPSHIVIFAGYPKEMRNIYKANPGLRSRIFKEIEFSDYSIKELYKILELNLSKYNISIDKNSKKNILEHIEYKKTSKDFGNARYIEQLTQILISNHANRKLKKENFLIEEIDVPNTVITKDNKTKFGFIGG